MNDVKISYDQYRKTPEWIARRNKRLQDEPNCECCGVKASMVHHFSYKILGGNERDEDIVSICENCHEKCHHVGGYKIKNDEEELRKRFEEIREENGYSGIKLKLVERRKEDIENADITTLIRLDGRFSKDKNHVYELGKISEIFDTDSFEVVGKNYLKDKNGIYLLSTTVYYGKEDNCYTKNEKINGINPMSFEIINSNYSKDNNYVLKNGKKLTGVNGKSFEILDKLYNQNRDKDNIFYRDKDNIYYGDKLILGADPKSFEIIGGKYAKDVLAVFFKKEASYERIDGADPLTFIYKGNNLYKDKNYIYKDGIILKSIWVNRLQIVIKILLYITILIFTFPISLFFFSQLLDFFFSEDV